MNALILRKRLSLLWLIGVSIGAFLLGGCGGGEDEAAATTAPTPSGGNRAPTVSGTPLGTVLQGTAYSFRPNASDPDGNSLTFSIANLPAWAVFDSSTGLLSGTPTSAHVGTYGNITISVSDGSSSASLPSFTIQVVATATGSAMLSWTPPTQNTDGSPLNNLAGYRIYWGTSAGSYTNSALVSNPGLSSYTVDQLTPAQWFFVVTAVSSTGAESAHSNEASKRVM